MAAPAAAAGLAWGSGLSSNGGALSAALPTAFAAVLAFGLATFVKVSRNGDWYPSRSGVTFVAALLWCSFHQAP